MAHYWAAACLKLGHGRDGQVHTNSTHMSGGPLRLRTKLHLRERRALVFTYKALFVQMELCAWLPSTQAPSPLASRASHMSASTLHLHTKLYSHEQRLRVLFSRMELRAHTCTCHSHFPPAGLVHLVGIIKTELSIPGNMVKSMLDYNTPKLQMFQFSFI